MEETWSPCARDLMERGKPNKIDGLATPPTPWFLLHHTNTMPPIPKTKGRPTPRQHSTASGAIGTTLPAADRNRDSTTQHHTTHHTKQTQRRTPHTRSTQKQRGSHTPENHTATPQRQKVHSASYSAPRHQQTPPTNKNHHQHAGSS
jgi:hypothetical protein